MLGELAWQQKPDSSLDLSGGDGAPLVVVSQTAGLGRNALKDVIHERVHDRHSFGRDSCVGVDLLEHLVDVDAVAFLSPPLLLLIASADGFRLTGFLGSFTRYFGRHVARRSAINRTTGDTPIPLLLYHASPLQTGKICTARDSERADWPSPPRR